MSIGSIVLDIIYGVVFFIGIYFGGKNWIIKTVYELMVKFELELGSGTGKQKFLMVLEGYETALATKFPKLKYLIKFIFNEKFIVGQIEKLVHLVNEKFRKHYKITEKNKDLSVKETAIRVIDKFKNEAHSVEFRGDPIQASNWQISQIADKLTEEVSGNDKNGEVYASSGL